MSEAAYTISNDVNIFSDSTVQYNAYAQVEPTPTTRVSSFQDLNVELYGKLESYNPTGSIKYRPAVFMLHEAMAKGHLIAGDTVIESSSGNLGAALAHVCCDLGLNFICVVDENAQDWNVNLIRQYGGQVETVRRPIDGCFLRARLTRLKHLLSENPDLYWINQYANLNNLKAHYETTAQEIINEYGDSLDIVCVPSSSTGTIGGIKKRFSEESPRTKIVAIDSKYSTLYGRKAGVRKIPGMGAGVKPALADLSKPDHVFWASDHHAIMGCYRALENDNLFLGGSSGAALEMVYQHNIFFEGKKVLLIFPDGGEKYKDTIYDDRWLRKEFAISQAEFSQYSKKKTHNAA